MFYVILQQQLWGKHDAWHNFHDENYFQEKNYNVVTLAQLTKYSPTPINSLQKAYTYNW